MEKSEDRDSLHHSAHASDNQHWNSENLNNPRIPHPVRPESFASSCVRTLFSQTKCFHDTSSAKELWSKCAGIFLSWIIPFREPLNNDFLGFSSMIHMLLDPLFLYVPLINESIKCVMVDNRVNIAALLLRSISDLRYLVKIIARAKDGLQKSLSLMKIARSIALDTFSLLPIPQGVVLNFLPNMRGSSSLVTLKLLNSLIVLQYLARVYPMYRVYRKLNESEHAKKIRYRFHSKRAEVLVNFSAFLLAGHVLGAFWYFFSVQREIDCWMYAASRAGNRSEFSFTCDQSLKNVASYIDIECPIHPPDVDIFDFGIFTDALESGMQESRNFPQKLLKCYSWGLRNLSSFGSNLSTSTHEWENLFVVVISISGLLLFIYLLGHVQGTTISYTLRLKMKKVVPKIQPMLAKYGLHGVPDMETKVERLVKEILKRDEDFVMENMFSILSSDSIDPENGNDLSDDRDKVKKAQDIKEAKDIVMEIKRRLFMDKLKKVKGLKDKEEDVWRELAHKLEPVMYNKGCYIIREGEPVDMIFYITAGKGLTYATKNGGSKSSIGSTGTERFKKDPDCLYGEELLDWVAEGSTLFELPRSAITVKSHNKVEVFALQATDLQDVFSEIQRKKDSTHSIAMDNASSL